MKTCQWEPLDREKFVRLILGQGEVDWEAAARRFNEEAEMARRAWRLVEGEAESLNAKVQELWRELEEAREVARHLHKSLDCWAYQAELIEAYPWMRGG